MTVLKAILGGITCLVLNGSALAEPSFVSSGPADPGLPEVRFSSMDMAPHVPFVADSARIAPSAILPDHDAGPAAAPGLRPLSREEGLRAALAMAVQQSGPRARPLAMVRYPVTVQSGAPLRPQVRHELPDTRWDNRSDADTWTRAALSALNGQRHDLSDTVPSDIGQWCPAYPGNPEHLRDAFWVGMMSALARHESMLNPTAVGGGGQWYGLLQIYPPTAGHFGCEATTGEALLSPTANLACAARIMTATVRRDGAVALHDGRWRGVAADWGPMTDADKRAEMMAWTRSQDYCVIREGRLRPELRPAGLGQLSVEDSLVPGSGAGAGAASGQGPDTARLRPSPRPWVSRLL